VAEEVEAVHHLLESKYEVVVYDVGEADGRQQVHHQRGDGEIVQDVMGGV
jgi:hypothetical protein